MQDSEQLERQKTVNKVISERENSKKIALKNVLENLGFSFDAFNDQVINPGQLLLTREEYKIQKKEIKKQKRQNDVDTSKQIMKEILSGKLKNKKKNKQTKNCDICISMTEDYVQCYNQSCKSPEGQQYVYCFSCFQQYLNMIQENFSQRRNNIPECQCGSPFNSIQVLDRDKIFYKNMFKQQIKNIMFKQSSPLVLQRQIQKNLRPLQKQIIYFFSQCLAVLPLAEYFDSNLYQMQYIIKDPYWIQENIQKHDIQAQAEINVNFVFKGKYDIKDHQQHIHYYIDDLQEILQRIIALRQIQQLGISIYSKIKSCELINYISKGSNLTGPSKYYAENKQMECNDLEKFAQLELSSQKPYTTVYLKAFVYDFKQSSQQIKKDKQLQQNEKQEEVTNFIRTDMFICKCEMQDCFGLVTRDNKICSICKRQHCEQCLKIKTNEHKCNNDDIENARCLVLNCKMCPKCIAFITRISGCDQMCCVICGTCFDWADTSIIYKNGIHNPHYFEYLQKKKNQELSYHQFQNQYQLCDLDMDEQNLIQILQKLWNDGNKQQQWKVCVEYNFAVNEFIRNRLSVTSGNQDTFFLLQIFGLLIKFATKKLPKTDIINVIDRYIEDKDKKKYQKYLWKIFRERERTQLFDTLQQQALLLAKHYIQQYIFIGFGNSDWKKDVYQLIEQTNNESFKLYQYYKCSFYYICAQRMKIYSMK